MRKKVIIIGSLGMLGSELVRLFKDDKNYLVIGWDKGEIDITNHEMVLEKILREKPAALINAAAYNAVDLAEENEKEFDLAKKVNGEGPKNLAEAAKQTGVVFVQYVTDYVFDGTKGSYAENDQTCPISNYGVSKELGEKNVQQVGGKYYLVRTSKLFGQPSGSAGSKKSFFGTILELAKEIKELKVVDSEQSCFTYVPDLARATKQLIEDGYGYGIYHLVNEGPATWYEGVLKLFEIAQIKDVKAVPVGPEEFPRAAKRPNSSVLLNTKFPKLRPYGEAIKEWLKFA